MWRLTASRCLQYPRMESSVSIRCDNSVPIRLRVWSAYTERVAWSVHGRPSRCDLPCYSNTRSLDLTGPPESSSSYVVESTFPAFTDITVSGTHVTYHHCTLLLHIFKCPFSYSKSSSGSKLPTKPSLSARNMKLKQNNHVQIKVFLST